MPQSNYVEYINRRWKCKRNITRIFRTGLRTRGRRMRGLSRDCLDVVVFVFAFANAIRLDVNAQGCAGVCEKKE